MNGGHLTSGYDPHTGSFLNVLKSTSNKLTCLVQLPVFQNQQLSAGAMLIKNLLRTLIPPVTLTIAKIRRNAGALGNRSTNG